MQSAAFRHHFPSPPRLAAPAALADDDQPAPVPPFTPETDAERREYAAAQERRRVRLGR